MVATGGLSAVTEARSVSEEASRELLFLLLLLVEVEVEVVVVVVEVVVVVFVVAVVIALPPVALLLWFGVEATALPLAPLSSRLPAGIPKSIHFKIDKRTHALHNSILLLELYEYIRLRM